MRTFVSQLFMVLAVAAAASTGHADEQKSNTKKIDESPAALRSSLRDSAWIYGSPHGAMMHNAFHGQVTTRLLLLKAAVREPILAKHLSLDARRLEQIKQLKPAAGAPGQSDEQANEQPDEEALNSDYFAFLDDSQLARLDRLAFQLDGYAAFTRRSVAARLRLSAATQKQIKQYAAKLRREYVMPRFQAHFAGVLPDNIEYRNVNFSARMHTQLNNRAVAAMTDAEVESVHRFVVQDAPPIEVVRRLEELAPLPKGALNLRRFLDQPFE